nr:restriction endonuclease [Advenella sp. FME57]
MQFEHKCAQVLRSVGWNARVTVASGDQGVDIEAERQDGYRIVVQCKYYSSPVGNSAVQEIAAGVQHYQANRGVVVSQASFTPAARRLAKTTNVLLVDLDDLEYIDSLLDGIEIEEMAEIEQSESVGKSKNAGLEINPQLAQYSLNPSPPADSDVSRIGSRFKRTQQQRVKSGLYGDES